MNLLADGDPVIQLSVTNLGWLIGVIFAGYGLVSGLLIWVKIGQYKIFSQIMLLAVSTRAIALKNKMIETAEHIEQGILNTNGHEAD